MGHDISIKINNKEINIFPIVGEGTYNTGKSMQDSLYITYNLSPIIYGAIEKCGLDIPSFGGRLDGIQAKDAIDTLEKIYNEIKNNPKKYKKLEPTNGRGTYQGLVDKLKVLIDVCKKYPKGTITDFY